MIDPRQYEAFKKFFADYSVVVKGELDAEYRKTAALIAEWDKRNDLGKLTSTLKQGQADLAASLDAFNKQKAAGETKLKVWEDGLKKREADLEAKVKAHATASENLSAAQATHDSTSAATKKAFEAQKAMLDQKAKDLENFQSSLHQRDLLLGQKEAKVQALLSQMNAAMKG